MKPSEDLRQAVRACALPETPQADALALARTVVEKGGGAVLAVVFFGSRKTQAGPDPWSAYDLFVITRDYRRFYRSLRAAGALGRPLLAAALNAVLPPNQISVLSTAEDGSLRRAKCAIISGSAFLRETSGRRRDHFCLGRLFQPTEILYAIDEATRSLVLEALVSAHALTYEWVRPWLPPRFDVTAYCVTLLRVSLAGEIRPEPEGRAEALFEAQKDDLEPVYRKLLHDLEAQGELMRVEEGVYALRRRVSWSERLRAQAYFRWSLIRATARWAKYILTFEDWLEYILRKARRHSGQEIVLTERERRLPLIFLWPRLVRYLRGKDREGRRA